MHSRQGDVLIAKGVYTYFTTELPEKAEKVDRKGPIVLAHGEVTGHKHAIYDKTTEEYAFDADMFIKALNATKIKHEEHSAVIIGPGFLPTGTHRVIRQKEYTPEEIRNVAD